MSYSNPKTCMYNFPEMDFGAAAGDTTHRIAGPSGKQGRVIEVGVSTSEAFACDTTTANVKVGSASDDDAYASLAVADGTLISTVFNSADDSDAIISADIAADAMVLVTLEEGTDSGTLTGKGFPYVIIDWF